MQKSILNFMHTADFIILICHFWENLTLDKKGADFMKKIISLLCTFFLAGCSNADIEKSSDRENKKEQFFQIGTMENEADLSKCSVHGWCRIIDENYLYRTTYEGDFKDCGELWNFIENLDFSSCEKAHTGFDAEYAVNIKGENTGFIRISSGRAVVYDYDDLENLIESSEPAIMIQTGESVKNHEFEAYIVPNKVKEQFDNIVANSVADKDNITDVYKLTDYSYTKITDSHPKDRIIFVDGYSNYAWEPQNHGRFIDMHGYVYEYDMDGRRIIDEAKERIGEDSVTYDQAFLDTLYYEFYYKNPPVAMVDADTVFDCYMNMCAIDRDADFELINECCDYGQHSLYMVDIDNKDNMLLKLRTKGDNTGELDDPAAEEIRESYDKLDFKEIAK